jgi:hypothetical protein
MNLLRCRFSKHGNSWCWPGWQKNWDVGHRGVQFSANTFVEHDMNELNSENREKRHLPKHLISTLTALALLSAGLSLMAPDVVSAPEVPFLVSAYEAAAKNPQTPGINATVTLTTLSASAKPPKVLIAQGPLVMEGDLLGARLPMTFDNASALEKDRHKLFFNISKSGRIGLQWLVDDKPFHDKPMQAFDTDAVGSTFTKKVNWYGALRQVTVSLERKLTFVPGIIKFKPTPTPKPGFKPGPIIIGGGVIKFRPTPTPTMKPVIVVGTIKLPAKGRRVKVTARFVVTNSDDGVAGIFGNSDKRLELGGSIRLGNQVAFSFNNRGAEDGDEFTSKAMESVSLLYSDPDHRFFAVSGKVWDKDTASASDTLWNASEKVDLIKIMENNAEHRIRGDRTSESGDLYIRVTDEGEFR